MVMIYIYIYILFSEYIRGHILIIFGENRDESYLYIVIVVELDVEDMKDIIFYEDLGPRYIDGVLYEEGQWTIGGQQEQ